MTILYTHRTPKIVAFALLTFTLNTQVPAQIVPTDASGECGVESSVVAAMFVNGKADLNAVAKAADSTLQLEPNCGFFTWTNQMFLWLTSPAPASYGGTGRIMFSPKFFTVTPEGPDGRRTFLPNNPSALQMLLRKTELGPNGFPALLAKSGHVVEVQPVVGRPSPPLVRSQDGRLVRIASARRSPDGALRLFDTSGREIAARHLDLPRLDRRSVELSPGHRTTLLAANVFQKSILAQSAKINNQLLFLDKSNQVIDVEPGQADDGVLLSQNGSLIYYITVVNDLYAYHRSMQGDAVIPSGTNIEFPTLSTDAAKVQAFASSKGHTILEPSALAVESKSSWIEASAVPNPDDYIQVSATVPTFDKSNANKWVPNGKSTVKLVMIGIHVVGSTNGHGELVWGTLEHVGNAPSASYSYQSTSGVKTVTAGSTAVWTFKTGGGSDTINLPNASWDNMAIVGMPVAPSTILRTRPWGTDGANTSLNTQVIMNNNAVLGQLQKGDPRKNYFQLGTTWTVNGQPPGQGNQVGTNQLANATIESFMQATSQTSGSNCFSCHFTNKVEVSHVYRELKPLP